MGNQIQVSLFVTGSVCTKERRLPTSVYRLPRAQQEDGSRPATHSKDTGCGRRARWKLLVFHFRSGEGVPPGVHGRREPAPNCLRHSLGALPMAADSFWIEERARRIPAIYGICPGRTYSAHIRHDNIEADAKVSSTRISPRVQLPTADGDIPASSPILQCSSIPLSKPVPHKLSAPNSPPIPW